MKIDELKIIPCKRCSRSLVLREVQIKNYTYCYYPLEWLNLKRLTVPHVDKNVELLEFSYIDDESEKWYTTLENFVTVSEG